MLTRIATCESRMIKIEGPAQSGKTEALVRRCAALIEGGAAPENILVITTTAFAAQAFRLRLEAAAGPETADVRVERVQDTLLHVLDTPAACEATGRVPYVLNSAERVFLLEDMKTLGVKTRKLRSSLSLFARMWESAAPEDKWLPAGEDAAIREALGRMLVERGAMLPEEVAFCCLNYLQSPQGSSAKHAYRFVLCDDFQNLSAAEQAALGMLAADQLVVAGNADMCVTSGNPYPNPQGFADFDAVRHDVEVFTLPARNVAPNVQVIKWNTPDEELDGSTKLLRVLADAEQPAEERICVLVPNRQWARSAESILAGRGFSVDTAALMGGLRGDPRELDRAQALIAYTKLCLLADDRNIVAWRSACGFGNYLTNSDAWAHMVTWAKENGIGVYEALERLADMDKAPFLRGDVLAHAFLEYRAFIQKNSKRRGFALLAAIGADNLADFRPLSDAIAGDEDAATMLALARKMFVAPTFPEKKHAVRLATPEMLCGLEFDIICVLGAVNGFYPPRDAFEVVSTDEDRDRIMQISRRAFFAAAAKAQNHLLVSFFAKADLELAERTKMQVARVRSEHDARVAVVRPSVFLDDEPFAGVGISGGSTLLAEYELD